MLLPSIQFVDTLANVAVCVLYLSMLRKNSNLMNYNRVECSIVWASIEHVPLTMRLELDSPVTTLELECFLSSWVIPLTFCALLNPRAPSSARRFADGQHIWLHLGMKQKIDFDKNQSMCTFVIISKNMSTFNIRVYCG